MASSVDEYSCKLCNLRNFVATNSDCKCITGDFNYDFSRLHKLDEFLTEFCELCSLICTSIGSVIDCTIILTWNILDMLTISVSDDVASYIVNLNVDHSLTIYQVMILFV
jgi:hypothetical protein